MSANPIHVNFLQRGRDKRQKICSHRPYGCAEGKNQIQNSKRPQCGHWLTVGKTQPQGEAAGRADRREETRRVSFSDIVVKQTGQASWLPTVDIQTSFHSFLLLLVHLKLESKWTQGREVALIQSTNCADWHSKHLRVRISGCPPTGLIHFWLIPFFQFSAPAPSSLTLSGVIRNGLLWGAG